MTDRPALRWSMCRRLAVGWWSITGVNVALEDLRRRCEQLAESLPIPQPFSAEAFVAALVEHRGRRIELVGMAAKRDTPCGMFVETPDADYIFYASNTTRLHQEHIIAHEIGHLLCGHKGTSALPEAVTALLMKNLSAKLISRVLGRTVYSEAEETEAEMLASVILIRGGLARPTHPVNPELAGGLDRLGSIFG
ncbi:ImmA/IrrE family metallo-endopeptidase [Kibdelosporangium philippinense]|uniref:ImmA/IrrE family metallo-endopeptidase n=1 Tax=Kibdelosporangium philippinense TaxID=211113 RepID=A0ABS8ZQD4_9PSEU|nr:ImmA/IrrE family metallo-endopeptidase [Kibdelosporangium philippinense]MCE7009789.1 ImmA/IrrE family metallo-endopeptidase [Kibdelosporangium philippinense]